MAALILKCVAGLPEYLLREERKQGENALDDDDDDDDDDKSVAGDAAVVALASNENSLKVM